MKDTYYFPHDSNARTDQKMLPVRAKYGAKGYGIYFMIIELLREAKEYQMLSNYEAIAYELHEQIADVQDVIENFGLFEFSDDGYFYSVSLKNRMQRKDEIIEKRRNAGKKGGQASAQAKLKQTSTTAQALKERKRKEMKRNNIQVPTDFQKKSVELSEFLLKRILENSPQFKYTDKTTALWSIEIEKLLRIDGRPYEEVALIIDFAQNSTFWRANILSGEKLRKQFDKLWLQKDQPQSGGQKKIYSSTLQQRS